MLVRLFRGAVYPFRALGFLSRTPGLWTYVAIPILINLLVGLVLYSSLLVLGLRQIDAALGAATGLTAAFNVVLRLLLIIGLLIVIGFVLVRFGVVLGSPWYAKLSEKIEQMQTGQAPPAEPLNMAGILRDLLRALLFEAKKLALLIGIGLPLLLINLLPGAGQVVSTLSGIALGALIACLDFLDGPLERRRLGFRQKLGVIRAAMPASVGFGLVCLGLITIPLVNLLSIPLCVAAGTLFFCDEIRLAAKSRFR